MSDLLHQINDALEEIAGVREEYRQKYNPRSWTAPSTTTIRYWETESEADQNIYYGFNDDWMIDTLRARVHTLDEALNMIHQQEDDEPEISELLPL